MKNVVFLDFDGVLFNTVKEAYIVSMIALNNENTINNLSFNSNEYKLFSKFRYLVSPAWNYKYILKLIIEDKINNFELNYRCLKNKANKNEYIKFEESYFNTRKKLKNLYFKKWLKLNEPYKFFELIKSFLINLADNFIIVTTKDKATVLKLLELNGIYFNSKHIYDNKDFEIFKDKANIIKDIMNIENITKAIFVDDNLDHLLLCKNINNLDVYQANWGYISEKDSNAVDEKTIISKIEKLIG
ncbi:HAD family hydrolase [Sulfurimonas sp.]|uniref:HAD family hydrolase n=1 Tax=Sulfurimonas sp. TaxID=2022749 RepID=UPI002B46A3F5|nr:HAD family hydrolase [Sulfurimonas sp.]